MTKNPNAVLVSVDRATNGKQVALYRFPACGCERVTTFTPESSPPPQRRIKHECQSAPRVVVGHDADPAVQVYRAEKERRTAS